MSTTTAVGFDAAGFDQLTAERSAEPAWLTERRRRSWSAFESAKSAMDAMISVGLLEHYAGKILMVN